ncbi:MAG: hypothetical protein ACI9DJ_000160 [Algoriphagus sp.]|jgi:hypothetical protein
MERRTHLVTIQIALGNDLFQDVATIDIEKNRMIGPLYSLLAILIFMVLAILLSLFIIVPLIF